MWDHAAYEALAKRSFGVPAIVVDSVIDGIVAFETDYTGQSVRKLCCTGSIYRAWHV